MTFSTLLSLLVTLLLGGAVGVLIGWLLGSRDSAPYAETVRSQAQAQAVVRHGLDRLEERLAGLNEQRADFSGELREQVSSIHRSNELLRKETATLSHALRRPQVRGRWGELHLRRTVELAGLVDRCDFFEQVGVIGGTGGSGPETGMLRPDLVVHLAGDRQVVVDSKVPLDAFLAATEAEVAGDDEQVEIQLARHARQLRTHVQALAAKSYWRSLPNTPEFVVLFVPGESFLAAALSADPALLDEAAAQRVILASPTTLIGLLRTIAWGWKQEAVVERAGEIHDLGRDLYERLGSLAGHLDKVGSSLKGAVTAYNSAIGALESRVLVTGRRLGALEVSEKPLTSPQLVEVTTRPPTAAELVEDRRTGVGASVTEDHLRRRTQPG